MPTNVTHSARVETKPTKKFFVEMLTRDIGVADCILDLIDNSLHGHIRRTGLDVTVVLWSGGTNAHHRQASVKLQVSRDSLKIQDDCGGIARNDAESRVFRLGGSEVHRGEVGLGVYGIGMKRAFFKLGNRVALRSRTASEEFGLAFSVDDWLDKGDDDWELDFSDPSSVGLPPLSKPGTTIEISELRAPISRILGLSTFQTDLSTRLSRTYPLFLKSGVSIFQNEKAVTPKLPEVGESGAIKPFKRKITFQGVEILTISGVRGDQEEAKLAGWYVFCNGRMVLEADRSSKTGWGTEFAEFHPKYNSFVGYLSFRSLEPSLLPWTTTKQDVVQDSEVYQEGLGEVVTQTNKIVTFLNRSYRDEDDAAEIARELRDSARPVTLDKLPPRESTFEVRPSALPRKTFVNILYRKPIKEVNRVRQRLEKLGLSARRVGEITFDYYLEKECD